MINHFNKMIYCIHAKKSNSTFLDLFLATLQFLCLTFFFFYSFTDICFDTINKVIPSAVIIAMLMFMFLDSFYGFLRLKKYYKMHIMNLVITTILLLSWLSVHKYFVYLGALIYLRAPELLYFYDTIHEQMRPYYVLYRLLIILRLVYLILVISQIFGCIFYLIDITLIQLQQCGLQNCGSISQNPSLFYQGQIVTFTPIYQLPEFDRYIYAIYYSISLLSTVAFGDIIPKNYIENAYVMVLLVLSTISIALIIEEMIIVFRQEKYILNLVIAKTKYLKMMMRASSISRQKQNSIIWYLINNQIQKYSAPKIHRLTTQTQKKLTLDIVCSSCPLPQSEQQEPTSKINHHQCLPPIIIRYLIFQMQHISIPPEVTIINMNVDILIIQNRFQKMCLIQVGYSEGFYASASIEKKKMKNTGVLLGWREMAIGTTANNPSYCVKTEEFCDFLMISENKFKQFIMRNRGDEDKLTQLQYYLLAKQKQILNNTDICLVCSQFGHNAIQCPSCHLLANPINILTLRKNKSIKFHRRTLKSKKIHQLQKLQVTRQRQQLHQNIVYYDILEAHYNKIKQFNKTTLKFEQTSNYKIFNPQYNIL